MFYNDHEPPHFHAIYGEYRVLVGIDTVEVIHGDMPRRALGLVFEWAAMHQRELADNWRRAREHAALRSIQPLD